jgi:hypothetical protein
MKKNKILFAAVLMVCLVFSGSLWAGEEKKDDEGFYGSFMFGYRMVDTDGTLTKYKEDINLEKGARLFHFKLHFAPKGNLKKLFDTMDVRVYNFGGDPFESFGVEVQKYGTYKFKFDRRKSAYFYSDNWDAHDYHTFDFDRIRDSGMLKVWLGKQAHAYIDFNRYTKKGISVTTFDFNRVEFEFDKPIDETSQEIAVGLDYSGKNFAIAVEERILDYDNVNSLFLPGYEDGGPGARYPSAMYLYTLNMPYDMEGNTHSAKFSARPFKSLFLRGSAQLITQDTNFSYFEDAWGVNYLGYEYMYTDAGDGSFERKMKLYDFDMTLILSSKLAFVGSARYRDFEQSGSFTHGGTTTNMDLNYENGGAEVGLQFQPSGKFGVTLGFRYERRDIEDEIEIEEENAPTDKTGFFGTINWKAGKGFGLTLDYQSGSYDNPFTPISPTDYNRLRLTAKLKKKNFYATGSYLYSSSDNSDSNWESSKNQLNLRLGFHAKKVKGGVGYSLIDVKREGDITVYYPPAWSGGEGSFAWDILFEGQSSLFDAFLYFYPDKSWALGGYFNSYTNKGSWELSRSTLKAFVKYKLKSGFITQLVYRLVDFKEKDLGLNDYKANILEISFGYQW